MPNVDLVYWKSQGTTWGIDISHHQQKINWKKMDKENTPHFIFLKATTHKDSKHKEYKRKAKRNLNWRLSFLSIVFRWSRAG
jgi:GH25 family lysozyme M1 (1,4-beta-N-acetylmuramidase)